MSFATTVRVEAAPGDLFNPGSSDVMVTFTLGQTLPQALKVEGPWAFTVPSSVVAEGTSDLHKVMDALSEYYPADGDTVRRLAELRGLLVGRPAPAHAAPVAGRAESAVREAETLRLTGADAPGSGEAHQPISDAADLDGPLEAFLIQLEQVICDRVPPRSRQHIGEQKLVEDEEQAVRQQVMQYLDGGADLESVRAAGRVLVRAYQDRAQRLREDHAARVAQEQQSAHVARANGPSRGAI